MIYENKEVYFCKYCPNCTYFETDEQNEPCNTCLTYFYNQYSHKPILYEPKEKNNGPK